MTAPTTNHHAPDKSGVSHFKGAGMSIIREHATYTAHCGGCGNMYGDTFDSKTEAQDFIQEFPLCSTCNPEGDK
jgi:hypothetical protein